MGLIYKVVETSDVSDVELERILNEWTSAGWSLDTMQFAMRDSSKRPAMASATGFIEGIFASSSLSTPVIGVATRSLVRSRKPPPCGVFISGLSSIKLCEASKGFVRRP